MKIKMDGMKIVDADTGEEIRDEDLNDKLKGPIRALRQLIRNDPELVKLVDGYCLRAAFGS